MGVQKVIGLEEESSKDRGDRQILAVGQMDNIGGGHGDDSGVGEVGASARAMRKDDAP